MSAARSRPAIDFGAVAALALANARHLLLRWFPAGRARGRNFCVGDLDGGRGESLCVSTASGQWIDFARPSDRGGDLTALRGRDNKITYAPVLSFRDKATADRFSAAMIAAFEAQAPDFLIGDGQ